MPRPDLSDPAGLATLARRRDREIRPTLLRLQARAFADAPIRDRRACLTFEALVCGLLPLVPDTLVAEIAAMLAPVPETPPAVRRMLDDRLSMPEPVRAARDPAIAGHAIRDLLGTDRRDVDRALAGNRAAALDARAIAVLVERGRSDPGLARLLLDRPEPGPLDRAALYVHADRPGRDAIRLSLPRAAAVATVAVRRPTKARRARLLAVAERGDWAGLLGEIATALAIAPLPDWPRDREGGRELVALGLGLLGLDGPERLGALSRVVATLEPDEPARLAALGAMPVACAALLVGAGSAPKVARRDVTRPERMQEEAEDQRRRRSVTARPSRAEETSGRPDRRSRSTTGRDRT